ncbi:hypothetical protein BH11MYX2_BH11MYX2_20730 [soil metagenome]
MAPSRFHVLRRRFTKLASAGLDALDPAVLTKLLSDTDAYFAAPREPELTSESTDFGMRASIRTTALRLVDQTSRRPWSDELAAFLDRLPKEEVFPNGARFSSDFVSEHAVNWYPALKQFVDRPGLQGLEVGSFEGRSCTWFLTNILTHPSGKMTCIDTFDFGGQGRADIADRNLQDRFDHNIAAGGFTDRVTKVYGSSQQALRTQPMNHFDFAYIDGSHLTCDVLEDVVLTWRLLRPGAVLILDDYGYWRSHENDPTVRPDVAIDAFMNCFVGQWSEVHRAHQIILRKEAA